MSGALTRIATISTGIGRARISAQAGPFIAVLCALAVAGVLLAGLGVNPFFAYRSMVTGALGSTEAMSDTAARLVPICLIALGVALTFRCGLWNVGGEGQFYAGAIGAALTGILIDAPTPVLIPLEVLAGIASGAAAAFVPALFKARFNTNEILVTLMFNFVPILLASYFIAGPFAQSASETTVDIHAAGELPWLVSGDLRLHAGLPMLLVAVAGLGFLVKRTTFGYRMRAIGSNILAARAAGIHVVQAHSLPS